MRFKADTDDSILLMHLRENSHQAFECLFNRYYRGICAYASRFVGPAEAEDVADDCMVWVWEKRHALEIHTNFRQYLFTMAYHRASNLAIQNKLAAQTAAYIDAWRRSHEINERDFVTEQELRDRIRAALEHLPETYRDTFVMHRFEGKSYKEIAAIYGLSAKTVDYRIQQALKMLRKNLSDYLPLVIVASAMAYLAAGIGSGETDHHAAIRHDMLSEPQQVCRATSDIAL